MKKPEKIKLEIDKAEFIEYYIQPESSHDTALFISEIIDSLKQHDSYSIKFEDMLSNTDYLPSYCIDNWEELAQTKVLHQDEIDAGEINAGGLKDWDRFDIKYVTKMIHT